MNSDFLAILDIHPHFTPATSAFSRDASTILLNHFDISTSQYDISSSDDSIPL